MQRRPRLMRDCSRTAGILKRHGLRRIALIELRAKEVARSRVKCQFMQR